MSSLNASAGLVGEDLINKHSLLLQDSSSDSDSEGNATGPIEINKGETTANEFFGSFHKNTPKSMLGAG